MPSARAWVLTPLEWSLNPSISSLTTIYWRPDADFLTVLHEQMCVISSFAWAARTKKTLNTQAKAFKEFAELAEIEFLPLTGRQLCYYAVWLWTMRGLKSPKSIKMYLSAVRTLHRRIGLDCATPTAYGPLDQLISGLKRLMQHKVRKSLPITPIILKNLLCSVPSTPNCAIQNKILTTFRALTLLFFQSMLRCSNMIPENRHDYDARYILKWSNITKVEHGVEIAITISKNNQYGERVHVVPLAASPDRRFCPVYALTALAKMYGPEYMHPSNPVFMIPTPAGSFIPLQKAEYLAWFRARLTAMDLVAADYGIHSYRHGGIQEALLQEQNRAMVQLASDHSSEAIMGYCAIPTDRRMYLSARVNRSLALS